MTEIRVFIDAIDHRGRCVLTTAVEVRPGRWVPLTPHRDPLTPLLGEDRTVDGYWADAVHWLQRHFREVPVWVAPLEEGYTWQLVSPGKPQAVAR